MASIPSFAEAIRDAKRRRVVLPHDFYNMLSGRVRAAAATVSGLAGIDQVQAVIDSVRRAAVQGESFNAWQKRLLEADQDFGLTEAQRETIFRTNVQGWYGAGRAEQIERLKNTFPYLRYSAILDSRTRPAHAVLDGMILPVDSDFWKTHYPPWAFNCRCTVLQMTERQAMQAIEAGRKAGKFLDQIPRDVEKPAPSWNYNRMDPAGPLQGLENAVFARAGQCVPRLFARAPSTPLVWCDGPGADALKAALTALQYNEPMAAPRALPAPLDMPAGLAAADYVRAFMHEFGDIGASTILYDSVVHQAQLAISADLFETNSGASKLHKNNRHLDVRYIAEGITDPAEVWLQIDSAGVELLYFLSSVRSGARTILTRAVFKWTGQTWEGVTAFSTQSARSEDAIRAWLQSAGTLLYRR